MAGWERRERRVSRALVTPWTASARIVRAPISSKTTKRLYRHISQSCCPWIVKFSQELAEDSPFRARPFQDVKDAVTPATNMLAPDQERFSALFRRSPIQRAGLRQNPAVVPANITPAER